MASLTDCESNNDKNVKDEDIFNELSPLKSQTEIDVEEKQNETKKISFLERLNLIKKNTTVEPIMVCYIMTNVLVLLARQNLNLEKACRVNLNISNTICDDLRMGQTEKYTEFEAQVQTVVARILSWKYVIQTSLQLMVILFVGAWSDKTGRRKALILLPLLGEFITCIGSLINTYFFLELPAEVAVMIESIFPALTGGFMTNNIGIFSYISDITTDENRTYRMGIVDCFMVLGLSLGNALSGVLLSSMGYYGIYSLAAFLYLFCLVYGFLFLEDSKRKTIIKSKNAGCAAFLRDFFDINLIMETFEVVFKKKAGRNRRLRISLVIIVVCVVFGPLYGETSILYMFIRYRFSWDEVQFSLWSTFCVITNLMGTMFSVNFFSGYLKLDDTLLGIISNTSKILAAFVYAFARNTLEIYLAPLVEILNGTSFVAIRSLATKVVNSDEIGRMNSLLGLANAMIALVYGSMYARVYEATIGVLPGAFFLVGAGLTLSSVAIFGWLYFERKKDLRLTYQI